MNCLETCQSLDNTVNNIIEEIQNNKTIDQFFRNHADSISSSNEVVKSNKSIVSSLGLTMPPRGDQPSECVAVPVSKMLLITLNFPRDQKLRLNKKLNYKWKDYKSKEQLIICNRIQHYFNDEQMSYNIYYEYCKDGSLHIHCIVKATQRERDIKIDINRFYDISSPYFCDVRPVTDVENLKEYLTNKKDKAYQSSGIPPIIKII